MEPYSKNLRHVIFERRPERPEAGDAEAFVEFSQLRNRVPFEVLEADLMELAVGDEIPLLEGASYKVL